MVDVLYGMVGVMAAFTVWEAIVVVLSLVVAVGVVVMMIPLRASYKAPCL